MRRFFGIGDRRTSPLSVGEGLAPPAERFKPYVIRVSRSERTGVHQSCAYQILRRRHQGTALRFCGTFILHLFRILAPPTPVRRRKKTALRLRKAVHRGIGIRTPTYRVRVCCATVTQYPYPLRFGFVLCRISLTGIIISRSIPFVNTLFKLFQKNLSGIFFPVPPPSVQCRTLQFLHKCGIIW